VKKAKFVSIPPKSRKESIKQKKKKKKFFKKHPKKHKKTIKKKKKKKKKKLSTAMDSQHRTVASPPSSQGRDFTAILFPFLSFFAVVALVTLPLSSLRFHNIFILACISAFR